MRFLPLTTVLLVLLPVCGARRMGRCEVARAFRAQGLDGFEGFSLGNYVCMAFWESKWKTHKVREDNNIGKDYGIFQINSLKWCEDQTPGGQNLCNVQCGELLNDDLKASVECAKIIVRRDGLKAWDTWNSYCNGRKMKRWVRGCDLKRKE
ncbi:lysozyme C [Chanos chanos]|uniref:lysozyme n=1 Tax=Chanos chanos TaxID=29144 RepID=A0A6J2UUK0_CHACN|nr:lysozyme C-like [Chanos chanos]